MSCGVHQKLDQAILEHSAVYDGKTDRVMIGINFYNLF